MKKLRVLLFGTLAGFLWFYAFSLAVAPVEGHLSILVTLACELGAVMLVGLGCTVAQLASKKEVQENGKDDL